MSRGSISVTGALIENLPRHSALLAAVSGGVDSVCLLHALIQVRQRLDIKVEIAHLDHGIRKESGDDAAFVKHLAEQLGIPCHVRRARRSAAAKENLENWGRRMRYAFFSEVLVKRDLDYVLTAHNADDVAETLLMRLVSNKELNTINFKDEKRKLIRPLLGVTRDQISSYARKHKLRYAADSTNQDTSYLRNRVRHKLIPLLKKNFDRRIVEVLSARAAAIDEDQEALQAILAPSMDAVARNGFGTRAWLRSVRREMFSLPVALHWRFVEELFRGTLGYSLGRRHAYELVQLLNRERGGAELPGGYQVRLSNGGIEIHCLSHAHRNT